MSGNLKHLILAAALLIFTFVLAGCGGSSGSSSEEAADPGIADGTYTVTFTTDNSMFHINEANEDKALLTVKDGKMNVHITLQSKKIVNLYPGLAEDAQKDGAELLQPTTDHIVYKDGYEEDVYGFDVPVPALDEEFDLALIGTKGKWYDHKVVVSDPVEGNSIPGTSAAEGTSGADADAKAGKAVPLDSLEDGEYQISVAMEGGTGRASVDTPAKMVMKDGRATMTVTWSSPHYDYMIVDGEKYEPVNTDGNSVFEIPVASLGEAFTVIADTTAMSEPHEIEYSFTCLLLE